MKMRNSSLHEKNASLSEEIDRLQKASVNVPNAQATIDTLKNENEMILR